MKGVNVHGQEEKQRLIAYGMDRVIVLDQGSRPGPPLIDQPLDAPPRVLIIDHHQSTQVSRHLVARH